MGNCVSCGSTVSPAPDGQRPKRHFDGEVVARVVDEPKLGKGDVSPARAVTEAKRKISRRKAEELLRIVETQGLPLHQVFAHLLPDSGHVTVCGSPHRRSPNRLVKVDEVPVQPATEVKTKIIGKNKAEELLRIMETQGLPLHQVFTHLLPDTGQAAVSRRRRRRRLSAPKLAKVDGSPEHPAATEAIPKKSKKKAKELLRIVETQALPMDQVFAGLLPDTDRVATVLSHSRRWRPALDSIPEVAERRLEASGLAQSSGA